MCVLLAGLALLAVNAFGAERPTNEQALKLLKSGQDSQRGVQLFEEIAASGDPYASLMLGAIYLEGKYVPLNRPRGFAYLQFVAQNKAWSFKPMRIQAEEWIRSSQGLLSGSELIQAEQLVIDWNKRYEGQMAASLGPALRLLTTETPVAYDPIIKFANEPVRLVPPTGEHGQPPFQPGCAAVSRRGCPDDSKVSTGTRCTGQLFSIDAAPSTDPADGALLVTPDYPPADRREGRTGTAELLLHLDSSGWVCGMVLATSSGTASLDVSAMDAVGKWKFKPATKNGIPMESLHSIKVTFKLVD